MSYGEIGYFNDPADEPEDRNDDSAKYENQLDDDMEIEDDQDSV